MGYSPVYDEPALRGKSRDELIVLACNLSVRVVHLEQVLEQKAPAGDTREIEASMRAAIARIGELEGELKSARELLTEAEQEQAASAAKDERIAALEAALATAQTAPAPAPAANAEPAPAAPEAQDTPNPRGKARGK